MGEIYKITNKINEKVYIGQTCYTTAVRWYSHIEALYKGKKNPLYQAMRKYGEENFEVECIEVCDNEQLDEREIYYIKEYDSYRQGHNATLEGGGRKELELNVEEIQQLWELDYCVVQIASLTNSNEKTVKYYLASQGIPEEELSTRGFWHKSKKICQIDYYTREILKVYDSVREVAEVVGASNGSNIASACLGRKPYAQGFIWRYWEDISEDDKIQMTYSGELPKMKPYFSYIGKNRKKDNSVLYSDRQFS